MADVQSRDLRNHTADVLRRVEAGEELTVTVSGRPVARLVPLQRRRPHLTLAEIRTHQSDPELAVDLHELTGGETIDDIKDPWDAK